VNTGGALTMNAGSKISGNTWLSGENSWGGGVTVDGGTFTMNGGEISGNSSTSTFGGTYYTAHGGGVHIGSGTFTMNGGEISGNSSKTYGGGVNIGSGTFTMNGGEISGNSSAVDGGGIYVEGGTFTLNAGGNIHGNTATYGGGVYSWASFTMNGGNISGNTATIYGGGVLVNGTCVFTMSGGNISGNTASRGGGLCIYGGTSTSTMSGAARVDLNNTVYINSIERFITIGAGGLTGSDPAALVEPAVNIGFIGKPAIKWQEGESGALPVDRFKFTSGWTADADGILNVKALPLTASGETAAAYLSGGSVHFYRFTPVLNKNYTITHTKPSGSNGIYTAAAWADGSGTLTTNTSSGSTSTSGSFNANKQVDIIIMVYNAAGDYTIKYTEQ
jgi:predicted outer membrane repeat protein